MIYLYSIDVINVKLCIYNGTTHWASYHFQWSWPYLTVTAVLVGVLSPVKGCQTLSLNENFMFIIQLSWNLVGFFKVHAYDYFWFLHIFKQDTNAFPDLTKNFVGFLNRHCLRWSFKFCIIMNFAQSLSVLTKLDDPDHVSRAQVIRIKNCKLFFRCLSTVNVVRLLHRLKRSCKICFVWKWCVFTRKNAFFFFPFCTWMRVI